jgi:hypothetical protein
MANKFSSVSKSSVGLSLTDIYELQLGTSQSDKQTVIVSISLCNTTQTAITASVKIDRPATTQDVSGQNAILTEDIFLAKNIPIPAGSSIEIMSGQKVVLQFNSLLGNGDKVQAQSSSTAALDVILSYMELS